MEKIQITTLILHADDDPVVTGKQMKWGTMIKNKHLVTVQTKRGGHCAWYEGILPFGETWSDRVSSSFISGVFELHSQVSQSVHLFVTIHISIEICHYYF